MSVQVQTKEAMIWYKQCSWVLILCALSWCMGRLTWGAAEANLLDGKSYVGKNGEVGKKLAEYEDEGGMATFPSY